MADATRRLRVKIEGDPGTNRTFSDIQGELKATSREATKTGYAVSKAFDTAPIEKQKRQVDALARKLEKMKALVAKNMHVKLEVDSNVDRKKGFFGNLIAEAKGAGEQMTKNLSTGMESASKFFMSPAGIAIGGAVALAAAPVISSAVSAAVIGGAGTTGIIGGIILASKDSRVQAAASDLKKHIGAELKQAAIPFIPAVLDALKRGRTLFDGFRGDIKAIFAKSATFMDPLITGAEGFARAIVPAIRRAVDAGGPFFKQMGVILQRIGQALARAMDQFSRNSGSAGASVVMIGNAIVGVIDVVGKVIGVTASWFKGMISVARAAGAVEEKLVWIPGLRGHIKSSNKNLDEMAAAFDQTGNAASSAGTSGGFFTGKIQTAGEKAKAAADKVRSLFDALLGLKNQALAASNSAIGLEQAIDDASASFKENRKTLDINTAAGRANKSALNNLASASNQLASDVLTQTGSQNKATAAAERGRAKFIELAKKMGLSSTEAKKLADKLIAIPKNNNVKVTSTGIPAVKKSLESLLIAQEALKKGIPVSAAKAAFNKNAYASGGPVKGPGTGTSDSIPARLSRGEYVVKASSVSKYGEDFLNAINQQRYAGGGLVNWPFPTTAKNAKIMSMAEAQSKVIPAAHSGMTSQQIIKLVHSAFPGLRVLSAYRPGARTLSGNKSYHSMNRAVDWPASKALAQWLNSNFMPKIKELITPWNSLNIHNGRPHRYSGDVFAQHAGTGRFKGNAHDHVAFDTMTTVQPGYFQGYNGTGRNETLVNSDLIGGITWTGDIIVNGAGDPKKVAKEVRDELIKLGKRNGGSLGLPKR